MTILARLGGPLVALALGIGSLFLTLLLLPTRGTYSTHWTCKSNLAMLGTAPRMYATDSDGYLPPVGTSSNSLSTYLPGSRPFDCPGNPGSDGPIRTNAYAMNELIEGGRIPLAGHGAPASPGESDTVLLFESNLGRANASGGFSAVCRPPRHYDRNNYLFADGHVAALTNIPPLGPPMDDAETRRDKPADR